MRRKKLWKTLTAWLLILGMVFSDGAFIANAQEVESQEKSLDKKEAQEENLNEEEEAGEKQLTGEKQFAEEGPSIEEEQPSGEEQSAEEEQPAKEEQPAGGTKAANASEKISEEKGTEETVDSADINSEETQTEEDISTASLDELDEEASVINCWFLGIGDEQIMWDESKLEVFDGQSVNVGAWSDESSDSLEVTWAVYKDKAAMESGNKEENILTQTEDILTFTMTTSGNDADYILCAIAGNTKRTINLKIHKQRYEYQIEADYVLLNGGQDLTNVECRYWNAHYIYGNVDCVPVDEVSVISGQEFLACDNSSGYWCLKGKELGTATIKITCGRIGDDPSEGNVTFTKEIKVTDHECWLNYRYPDSGQEMLTNSTMVISDFVMSCTALRENEDGDTYYEGEEIKDSEISVVEFGSAISGAVFEGGNLVINSGPEIGETYVRVRAKSGKYECEEQINIFVKEDYYILFPQSVDNLNIGELLDLNKLDLRVMHYDKDNKTGKRVEGVKFQFPYDENLWETQEKTGEFPVLKRITPQWVDVPICACLPGETEDSAGDEVAYTTLSFGQLYYNYDDIEYKYTYEGQPSGEGSDVLFLGTPLTLELVPKDTAMAFPEGCQFKWNITEGGSYVKKTDNSASTTLTGNLPVDEDYAYFYLKVRVLYKEYEMFNDNLVLYVRKPWYTYDVSLGDNEVIKGESLSLKPTSICYYQDIFGPDGASKKLPVTKVEIAGEYQWDNEGQDILVEKGKIASITEDANTGWVIHGKDFGTVELDITFEPMAGDPSNNTVKAWVYVGSDVYRLNWKYPAEYVGRVKPKETFTISDITMTHEYLDAANKLVKENITDFMLSAESEDEEDGTKYPRYNSEVIDVEVKDHSLVITGKNEGHTIINLGGMMKDNDENGAWVNIPVEVSSRENADCSVHAWSSWNETKKATCEQSGLNKRTCKNCGTEETQTIPETGHSWTSWSETKKTTCGQSGLNKRTCQNCGIEETQVISATEHSWTSWSETKKATCDQSGLNKRTCQNCGIEETQIISATGHSWTSWKEAKKATCAQSGLNKRTCQNCGTEQTQTISSTGHKWGAWKVKTLPTVFSAGTQTRTCSVCKKSESAAHGSKLTPTMKLTAKSLTMQVKQTTKAFKVTGMASGDYVSSVKSNNKKILKVSGVKKSGTFKLAAQKKTGTATLTIKLASGLEKKVKVKVQKKAVKTSKISGLSKKLTMKKKATKKLTPIITPVTSKDKIQYTSSNKKVATVTSKGVIKAKKAGKAKITVKAGSKKFVVAVTVK